VTEMTIRARPASCVMYGVVYLAFVSVLNRAILVLKLILVLVFILF